MEAPPGFVEPSLGRRLGARLIDNTILFVPLTLLRFTGSLWVFIVLTALVTAAYEITLVVRDGQTLGKRWLGLRVVDARTGEIPTLNQAALRWAVPEVAALAPVSLIWAVVIAIYLPVLKGPLHRGLHDHAAGTVVTASRR